MSRLTNGEHLLLTIIMVAFVLWLLALPARADLAPVAEPTVIARAGTPIPITGTPPVCAAGTACVPYPTLTPTPPWVRGPGETDEPPASHRLYAPVVAR